MRRRTSSSFPTAWVSGALLFLIAGFTFAPFSNAAEPLVLTPHLNTQSFPHKLPLVSDQWRVRHGDDPAWADPYFDDSDWELTGTLAPPAAVDPATTGVVWFRLNVRVTETDLVVPYLLTLEPRANVEVYADGRLMRRFGRFESRITSPWGPTKVWPDPFRFPDTDVLLALRYEYAPNREGVVPALTLTLHDWVASRASFDEVVALNRSYFYHRSLILCLLLTFLIFHTARYVYFPRSRTNFYYCLTLFLATAGMACHHVTEAVPDATVVWQVAYFLAYALVPCFSLVNLTYLYLAWRGNIPRYFWFFAALAAASVILDRFFGFRLISSTLLLFFVAEYIRVYGSFIHRRRGGAWIVGLALFCLAGGLVIYLPLDYLGLTGMSGWTVYSGWYGFCLYLAFMSVFNAREFALSTGELSELKSDLEKRIGERTEELRLEIEERRQAEEQIRALTQSAHDAIVSADSQGRIASWNHGAEQMFGYTAEEALRQPLEMLMPDGYRDAHQQGMARHTKGAAGENTLPGRSLELEGRRKDGAVFPLELSLSSWDTRDGRFFCGIIRDISDRKAQEAALHEAKEAAENANAAKSRFLANMSHEIRTPMNGIIGMAELLLRTDMTQQQRRQAMMIKESAGNLLNVINDVLDLSKIEAGRVELEAIDFNLHELMQQVIRSLFPVAARKQLVLACDIAEDVPVAVRGDEYRLREIVFNLLSNAIKFTEQGGCILAVARENTDDEKQDPDLVTLRFMIKDTGIGIAPDKHESIFDSFSQADAGTTRKYGGTGLGLAICRHLVEMMGGRIWVESAPGEGSTFIFTTRFAVVSPEALSAPADTASARANDGAATLRPLRVLLVEDNRVNQEVALAYLRSQGHRVTVAATGQEAVSALQAHKFDLVLMDIEMPDMDGMEATRLIRSWPDDALDRAVPIIAVTAHALKGAREQFLAAGMDDYISKPFNFDELTATMARVLERHTTVPAAAGTEHDEPRLDVEGALARISGQTDTLRTLFTIFLEDAPSLFESVAKFQTLRDSEACARAAHSLKSSARVVGAMRLGKLAELAERHARATDWPSLERLLPAVQRELHDTFESVRNEMTVGEGST